MQWYAFRARETSVHYKARASCFIIMAGSSVVAVDEQLKIT